MYLVERGKTRPEPLDTLDGPEGVFEDGPKG
jgi:hypothetical protein